MYSWPHEMFTVSLLSLFISAGVTWLSLGFISMLLSLYRAHMTFKVLSITVIIF